LGIAELGQIDLEARAGIEPTYKDLQILDEIDLMFRGLDDRPERQLTTLMRRSHVSIADAHNHKTGRSISCRTQALNEVIPNAGIDKT
jgi:hypothetical protein